MALENGVLYAMIGEQEQRDSTKQWKLDKHGWPWSPISQGCNQPENPWGYGRNILAIDPETKKVLWGHREQEPIDGRAICMKNGRIYFFRFGNYLTCLDAKTGNELWRQTPQNAREPVRLAGQVPESPGLADELADHVLSQVQRQGPLLRRAAHRQALGRLDAGREASSGNTLTAITSLSCRMTDCTGSAARLTRFPA